MTTDPSEWLLRTPGGVPYRFVQMDGDTTSIDAQVGVEILIESVNLRSLLREVFPPSLIIGDLIVPQPGLGFYGLPFLVPSRVSFRAHDDGRPIDPFATHLILPEEAELRDATYGHLLNVTIEFASLEYRNPDENDPRTFLEISTSQEDEVILRPDSAGAAAWRYDNGGELPLKKGTGLNIIRDPVTVWKVRWQKVNYQHFYNVLRPRLKAAHGKINSTTFPALFNAPPGTLLLTKFDYEQHFDWLDTQGSLPSLITLEIEIREKNFTSKKVDVQGTEIIIDPNTQVQRGWNTQWDDFTGTYITFLPDGANLKFESVDFNAIFSV
jgi:hypothetical protein